MPTITAFEPEIVLEEVRQPRWSYFRILHAVPHGPNIDVYANQNPVARNLAYQGFTPYIRVNPGQYTIRIFRTGQTTDPLATQDVTLDSNSIQTIAAIGIITGIQMQVIPDPVVPQQPGRMNLRFVNLAPNAPPLDVYQPDGNVLFSNIPYKQYSNYQSLRPGNYTFLLRPSGGSEPILYVPNIILRPGRNYSLYTVGVVDGTPALQLLVPLDGSSYLM